MVSLTQVVERLQDGEMFLIFADVLTGDEQCDFTAVVSEAFDVTWMAGFCSPVGDDVAELL